MSWTKNFESQVSNYVKRIRKVHESVNKIKSELEQSEVVRRVDLETKSDDRWIITVVFKEAGYIDIDIKMDDILASSMDEEGIPTKYFSDDLDERLRELITRRINNTFQL